MSRITREEETARRVKALRRIKKAEGGKLRSSHRELGREIGLTPTLARSLMRRLVRDGLIESRACFDVDGAQRANEYWITPAGERFYRYAPKRGSL